METAKITKQFDFDSVQTQEHIKDMASEYLKKEVSDQIQNDHQKLDQFHFLTVTIHQENYLLRFQQSI